MCENDDFNEFARRSGDVSRREFGAITIGSSIAFMLPRLADAAEVKESEVQIKTADGTCDAHFAHPASGKAPAVLVWPDIFGLRPAFKEMGKRLAESGYAVLTINPFYRIKKAPTAPGTDFSDPAIRKALTDQMGSLSPQTAETDAKAFVTWLDGQAAVDKKKKMGTTGYCMGGPFVFRTAAGFPARVGAGCTFHGGGLVTDKPDSPHLLIPKMKAQYLIAIAESDDKQQPTAKDVLKESFDKAKLHAVVEVFPGTQHGWCPPDARVYNHDSAEKAWGEMLVLFKSALV